MAVILKHYSDQFHGLESLTFSAFSIYMASYSVTFSAYCIYVKFIPRIPSAIKIPKIIPA